MKTKSPFRNNINGKFDKKVRVGIFVRVSLRYTTVNNFLINAENTEEIRIEIINPKGKIH